MPCTASHIGNKIYSNVVAVGTVAGLFRIELRTISNFVKQYFSTKSEDIVKNNLAAAKAGYELAENLQDFAYDANDGNYPGLLASQTTYYASGTTATTTYDYDGIGRKTKTTDPCNNEIRLTYDAAGRVTRRQQLDKDPLGTSDVNIVTAYVYDSLGRVYQQTAKSDVNDSNTWPGLASKLC